MFGDEDSGLITQPDQFQQAREGQVVVLDGNTGPLTSVQEQDLCNFIRRGGGLVCFGDAAEAYHEYPLLGEML